MIDSNSSRGLSRIPDYVLKGLDIQTRNILAKNGFGLSFPCRTGCQMRLIHKKKNLGGFYSYRLYGGIQKAVNAAINKNRSLRALLGQDDMSEKGFVYFTVRFDKRKEKYEWIYQVSYFKDRKRATKTFSLGYVDASTGLTPSAAKCLHTYLTARVFRFYFETLGDGFDEECFKQWKTCRLYMPGNVHFDWNHVE